MSAITISVASLHDAPIGWVGANVSRVEKRVEATSISEQEEYTETQFLADLRRASAPLKALAEEARAEIRAKKAALKSPKP